MIQTKCVFVLWACSYMADFLDLPGCSFLICNSLISVTTDRRQTCKLHLFPNISQAFIWHKVWMNQLPKIHTARKNTSNITATLLSEH